jgi:cytochrome c oxidase assembly protein subunit 15
MIGSETKFDFVKLWAWMAASFIFPLIWVGGLVTTHDAGMAVPDWPGTYGYNLFLYPLSTWLYGPFDLLIEHGHRLLGSWVGLLVILLCISAWRAEPRRWYRWACIGLLGAVIAQGLLGGFRVVLDQRTIAMIHGCGGPMVFAYACFLAFAASSDWKTAQPTIHSKALWRLSWVLLGATVTQLALGAQLRHALPNTSPVGFMSIVHLHLTFAGVVTLAVLSVWYLVRHPEYRIEPRLMPVVILLSGLLATQLALGIGTWIVNYALPWSETLPSLSRYAIAAKGYFESMIVTAHQATGSLLIAGSTWLLCRVGRRQSTVSSGANSFTLPDSVDSPEVADSMASKPGESTRILETVE